jgi:hypothetical protein
LFHHVFASPNKNATHHAINVRDSRSEWGGRLFEWSWELYRRTSCREVNGKTIEIGSLENGAFEVILDDDRLNPSE